ncbi:MAG: hypothetical protein HN980_06745 [Waddliaceae bacterium]|jgi:hypothetical protein|nr:hypothetical protein [Waddliaceae bacterium]MBT6929170.1 hypothetical protein [Waddliaceae bacterium]
MKILPFLLAFLALFSCVTNDSFKGSESEHVKAFNRMIAPFVEEMKKTEDLSPTIVSGELMDQVNTVALYFKSDKSLSIKNSRELYIRCTQKLLSYINDHEEIRPYLAIYPFTENEIEFDISFYNYKSYEYPSPPNVAHIFNVKQKIYYSIDTGATDNNPLKTIHEETYSEALKIVKGE